MVGAKFDNFFKMKNAIVLEPFKVKFESLGAIELWNTLYWVTILCVKASACDFQLQNCYSHTKLYSQWVFRVLKYPKKCLEDLTTFFISTWWGDSNNMAFSGQTMGGQKCAARWAELAVLFCRYVAQKVIVRIQFLAYFWNPLIK